MLFPALGLGQETARPKSPKVAATNKKQARFAWVTSTLAGKITFPA
jgi:hypothetical protein